MIKKNNLNLNSARTKKCEDEVFIYRKREKYHCKITINSIVRTKGKAGYLVWKFAGGQGDHEISLPLGSFEGEIFSLFFSLEISVANPFSMIYLQLVHSKRKI